MTFLEACRKPSPDHMLCIQLTLCSLYLTDWECCLGQEESEQLAAVLALSMEFLLEVDPAYTGQHYGE